MQINSTRLSLARSRMIRSARRKGRVKILSGKSKSTNYTNSTNKTYGTYSSSATSKRLSLYETVQKSALALQKNVTKLSDYSSITDTKETGQNEDTTTVPAKEIEEKKQEMVSYIKKFVENYNDMYEALEDIGGSSNKIFMTQLGTAYAEAQDELKVIGITKNSKGILSVNTRTLEAADIDKLQKVFCSSDGYASKVSSKCKTIADCAESTIEVYNKMYGTQTTYNKYGNNSYYYGSSGSRYSANG